MSLVRRGGIIQSEKFARKRRKKTIFVAILFVAAIASVCTAVFFFFQARFVQIKSIEVSGPVGVNGGVLSMVPSAAVSAEIVRDLSGDWLYFISRNTLFTYPSAAIRAQLLKEYPAAQSVDFQSQGSLLGFGNNVALRVFITERIPSALACDDACFYMDNTGFVYASAPQSPAGSYIRYRLATSSATLSTSTASSSFGIAPGKFFTDPATFAVARKIIGAVSEVGLDVVGDTVGSDAYGPKNDIVVEDRTSPEDASSTPSTTVIYFNGNEPLDVELRYFAEFWAQETASSSAIRFQYVDMRYGKDIVFKIYPSPAPTSTTAAKNK